MSDLVEREWFQRDPVTGNFVPATPPAQFSTAELTRMAEEITRLREALERAREAISMLNKDALGYAAPPFVHDPEKHQWPIRDDLLAEIDKALATRLAVGDEPTEAMLDAGLEALGAQIDVSDWDEADRVLCGIIWRAMRKTETKATQKEAG